MLSIVSPLLMFVTMYSDLLPAYNKEKYPISFKLIVNLPVNEVQTFKWTLKPVKPDYFDNIFKSTG